MAVSTDNVSFTRYLLNWPEDIALPPDFDTLLLDVVNVAVTHNHPTVLNVLLEHRRVRELLTIPRYAAQQRNFIVNLIANCNSHSFIQLLVKERILHPLSQPVFLILVSAARNTNVPLLDILIKTGLVDSFAVITACALNNAHALLPNAFALRPAVMRHDGQLFKHLAQDDKGLMLSCIAEYAVETFGPLEIGQLFHSILATTDNLSLNVRMRMDEVVCCCTDIIMLSSGEKKDPPIEANKANKANEVVDAVKEVGEIQKVKKVEEITHRRAKRHRKAVGNFTLCDQCDQYHRYSCPKR